MIRWYHQSSRFRVMHISSFSKSGHYRGERNRILGWGAWAVYLLVSILFFSSGYLFFRYQKKQISLECQKDLQAIADLKISQITRWLADGRRNALAIADESYLAAEFDEWVKSGEQRSGKRSLTRRLKGLKRLYGYQNIFILDKNSRQLLYAEVPGRPITEKNRALIRLAIMERKTGFSDIQRTTEDHGGLIYIDLVTPLVVQAENGTHAAGAMIFRYDLDQFLYPLIQSWPTPQKSAETLLVAKDGNDVLFLNELRHMKNTALRKRLPLDSPMLVSAMAVKGKEGVVEGMDYRDVPVLAALRRIPDTPWFMVSKVDQDEAYAGITVQKRFIIAVTLGVFLISAALFRLFWYKKTASMLSYLANVDTMTGLANRHAFNQFLHNEWNRALRGSYKISLIMIDIDFFKKFNDTYGHVEGDNCMRRVAAVLKIFIHRAGDLAARYGGEEFVVVLPMLDSKGAIHVAESLRENVENLRIPHSGSSVNEFVTISTGVATMLPAMDVTPSALIEQADKALYKAKDLGRNRVQLYTPESG